MDSIVLVELIVVTLVLVLVQNALMILIVSNARLTTVSMELIKCVKHVLLIIILM